MKGGTTVKVTLKSRKKNAIYEYKVCAYTTVNGKITPGKMSTAVFKLNIPTTTPTCTETKKKAAMSSTTPIVNPSKEEKFYRVFSKIPKKTVNQNYPGGLYTTAKKALKNMTTVTVKVWDYASGISGKKVTRTFTMSVHKKIAPTVVKIFDIIYKNPEKFPIHDLGGYRTPSGHSEHNTGTAMDLNYNENYQIAGGSILCGSLWKPGKNPYSIPTDGIVACAFAKYGFSQGIWKSTQDYMHFSYFHT